MKFGTPIQTPPVQTDKKKRTELRHPAGARRTRLNRRPSRSRNGTEQDPQTIQQSPPRAASMTIIITGNFEQLPDAQKALADLAAAGIAAEQMSTFFVSPSAEPDQYFEGDGPPPVDEAAKGGASGAAVGAAVGAVAGLATLPLLGPAAVAVAGAGAYVGSFAGAMLKVEDHNEPGAETPAEVLPDPSLRRKAGSLIAVAASAPELQRKVADILRTRGGTDIERTEGRLVGGQWTDFDPLAPLRLIDA